MKKLISYLLSSGIASLALAVATLSTEPACIMFWYQPEVPDQLKDM